MGNDGMTTAADAAAGTAGRQLVLQLTRASYGVALIVAPSLVIYLATGRFPGRRGRRVAQLLGTRHLVQAAATAVAPVPDVFALGAGADALHAGSMLVLAAADPGARHAALTDALAETLFAGLGWSVSVQAREGDFPQQQP